MKSHTGKWALWNPLEFPGTHCNHASKRVLQGFQMPLKKGPLENRKNTLKMPSERPQGQDLDPLKKHFYTALKIHWAYRALQKTM